MKSNQSLVQYKYLIASYQGFTSPFQAQYARFIQMHVNKFS